MEIYPIKYAEEFIKKIEKNSARAYLVNTGWNGSGKRIAFKHIRSIIDAILCGAITSASTKNIPYFDLKIPTVIKGVDAEILDPRNSYATPSEWEEKAMILAEHFIENFRKYEGTINGQKLVTSGPKRRSIEDMNRKTDENHKKKSEQKNSQTIQNKETQKGNSGCFITTAVCDSFHKPDNCYELTMFRAFRDNWLSLQADGASLINEYYRIAPAIVASINLRENAKEIYRDIWNQYLLPCLRYIESGDNLRCKELYISMVNALRNKFAPKINK